MERTSHLDIPLIMPSQAQKHVTHNEAISRLDVLVNCAAKSRQLTAPPAAPAEGDRYLVAQNPNGVWAGREGALAAFQAGGWEFLQPGAGWVVYVEDEDAVLLHDGGGWKPHAETIARINHVERFGLATEADVANPLSARLNAASFAALPAAEGGSGDIRFALNAEDDAHTASILFKTGWSGRAEMGLAGSEDFVLKASANGAVWANALIVDHETGGIEMPNTPGFDVGVNLISNPAFVVNQRGFAGGALAAGAYGFDRWKAAEAGANVTRVAGLVTIASGSLVQIVEGAAFGIANFAGKSVTVSAEGASGLATVQLAGQTRTLAPASPAVFSIAASPAVETLELRIAAQSGGFAFRSVKLETGSRATRHNDRPLPVEHLLCQRYFWRINGPLSLFLYAQGAGNYFFNSVPLPVPMRVTPSVTRVLQSSGNLFANDPANATASALSANAIRLSVRANAAGECYANFLSVDCNADY
ncbi:MAG: DUF2793 domain-containing protein [Phyllobacteriaceae bacterium]|nr:DUF2793 domain-containing protein [Phyllobacteriaceae bacterium]